MFIINYSQDILFLVLAFCALWVTFFIAWLVYYLIAAARQLHQAAQVVKTQADEVAGLIKKIKLAWELPGSLLVLAIDSLRKIAEIGKDILSKNKSGKKSSKTKNGLVDGKNG